MKPAAVSTVLPSSSSELEGGARRSYKVGSARRGWQRKSAFTAFLLLIWIAVTFGLTFFARELSFEFMGWPFSFWVAAQGALLVYLALIAVYAYRSGAAT
jgi:putative solute:sodium symporter small subunit